MSRTNIAVRAEMALRDAVSLQRRTGAKSEHAMEIVGDLFGLAPRRVRMWLRDEIINPSVNECALIMRRWWTARDLEVRRLRAIADRLEQDMERERAALAQLELPLGSVAVESHQSMDSRAAHALGSVANHLRGFAKAEAAYREARRGPLK